MHYEAFVMHNAWLKRSAICIFISKTVKQKDRLERIQEYLDYIGWQRISNVNKINNRLLKLLLHVINSNQISSFELIILSQCHASSLPVLAAFLFISVTNLYPYLTADRAAVHLHKIQLSSVNMPDSNEAVPAPCQVIKEDIDKWWVLTGMTRCWKCCLYK